MTDLTPETVAALRGRAGVAERLALSREQVLALLDAADERDRIKAELGDPSRHCIMGGWLVIDTRQHNCGTGPGGHYGAHEPGCGLEQAIQLDNLPGWPGDERDQLAAAVERVRVIHRPGDIMAWSEDCDDPDGHQWIDDPHGGGMLCADEIAGTYCMGCAPDDATDMSDYPYPCATLRALDGADDE